ncbi:hypothetical protein BP5796_13099 [Coleophoma crateriformis]|uniref:Amino acid transporter transmembrane domain-containing protein n=1 Tax=Coleophoma crateriformis TaxID=565419 RepID=A0A3D8Q5F0_9HELO|nr:hypothetical protein BP5796_13099 [Coleophoma crateriformis]
MGVPITEKPLEATVVEPRGSSIVEGEVVDANTLEEREVFKSTVDGVDFRTVTWQRAILIFLKVQIATGVLGIPGAFGTLGAVGGVLSVIAWQALNTYTAILLADFRNRHPECHTLVDECGIIWGRLGREIAGILFLINYVLCTGSGILGISTALNALSNHGACTVWFSFVGFIMITMFSSIRTWGKMTWPLTLAFVSVIAGVLVVVIGVSFQDRPAAAPQTGPFDLGFHVITYPDFIAGITASATIFVSSAAGPNYVSVIAEMKRPQDYRKAVYPVGFIVGAVYLSFSMVIYYYCGTWIATPSLGSAGPLLKKVAYGIAFPSLIVSAGLFNHNSSKYAFVRILRGTKHLQSNSPIHWSTWIACNLVAGFASFIICSAVPVFNDLLALIGSFCGAPMSIIIPASLWLYDFNHYRKGNLKQVIFYGIHLLLALLGVFVFIGGTYGTIVTIKASYTSGGGVGSAFSCADNSNTIAS